MALDVDRLLAEALAKHGIRLDPHDPAVVLVTLNRLVLEEVAKSVAADIRKATREFEEAAGRVQGKLGAAVAARLKSGADPRPRPATWSPRAWVVFGLGTGAGLFLTGIAIGRWILR
jgi:hypothetical protein